MSSFIGSLELVRQAKPVAIAAFSDDSPAIIASVESIVGGYRFQIWTTSEFLNTRERRTLRKIAGFFRSDYAKEQLRGIFAKQVTSVILVANTAKIKNDEIYQTVQGRKILWLNRLGTAVEKIVSGHLKDALHILRSNFLQWGVNLGMTGRLTAFIKVQENANQTLPLPRNGVVFRQSREVMFEEPDSGEKAVTVLGKRSRDPADPKPPEKEPRPEGGKIRPKNWKPEVDEESEIEQESGIEEESNRCTPDTDLIPSSPSSDEEWRDLEPVFAAREE